MKFSTPIHIVSAKRTPIGRLGGALESLTAVDLAVLAGNAALGVTSPEAVDAVIFGQVLQAGVGMNLARQVALRANCKQETPGWTVNMVCGSGLQAVAMGAREISLGEAGVVLAGGSESMSQAPHYAFLRRPNKFGDATLKDAIVHDGLTDPLHDIIMGETAERIGDKYGIPRQDQDAFALESHRRAVAASEKFAREIVPVQAGKVEVSKDEAPRADSTLEKLGTLKTAFRKDGTVTPGNASGLNDGAAAVLLASESALAERGLLSRARIVGAAATGCDPLLMGLGPVAAINKLCGEIGWKAEEVDAVEINEAFAVQTLGCACELNLDLKKLNQRGGGIALGHPIGASGTRVLVTLLHLMEDEGYTRGIASLCIGGGQGIALAIER